MIHIIIIIFAGIIHKLTTHKSLNTNNLITIKTRCITLTNSHSISNLTSILTKTQDKEVLKIKSTRKLVMNQVMKKTGQVRKDIVELGSLLTIDLMIAS